MKRAYKQDFEKIDNPQIKEMIGMLIHAGGRARMDEFYHNQGVKAIVDTLSDITRGTPGQRIKGVGKLPFSAARAGIDVVAKPILQWLVPRQKLGLFSIMAKHEMDRAAYEGLDDNQLRERLTQVWDSIENRMGQLAYDNLFWNKTLKDALMMAFRSVGWNLGSWREFGGAPIDVLTTPRRMRRGDLWLSHKIGYTVGVTLVYVTLGRLIEYVLTGKAPEEPKDYFFPRTGAKNPDGTEERLSLPTYAKDWWAYSDHPAQTIQHKLHPMWSTLGETWKNRDFFGTEIRNADDPIVQQLQDVAEHFGEAFIPFSVKNYGKMRRAGHGPYRSAATSLTGIVSAPAYITRSPARKLTTSYIVSHIPQGSRSRESFERSQLRKRVKDQLRRNLPVKDADRAEFTDAEWKRIGTEAGMAPFAESFRRLSFHEALNVYAVATDAERAQVRHILDDKATRAKPSARSYDYDDAMRLYHELTRSAQPQNQRGQQQWR